MQQKAAASVLLSVPPGSMLFSIWNRVSCGRADCDYGCDWRILAVVGTELRRAK